MKFDKYLFASEPTDLVGKTEKLVYEIESYECLPEDLFYFLQSKSLSKIADDTKALENDDFVDKCGMIKELTGFWIRCILLANKIVVSDDIINMAHDLNSSLNDLVNTISKIELLKTDKNIFPFVSNLINNYYSENNIPQLLEYYSAFLTAVSEAILH